MSGATSISQGRARERASTVKREKQTLLLPRQVQPRKAEAIRLGNSRVKSVFGASRQARGAALFFVGRGCVGVEKKGTDVSSSSSFEEIGSDLQQHHHPQSRFRLHLDQVLPKT